MCVIRKWANTLEQRDGVVFNYGLQSRACLVRGPARTWKGCFVLKLTGGDLIIGACKDVSSYKRVSITYWKVRRCSGSFDPHPRQIVNEKEQQEHCIWSYMGACILRLCVWHFSIHNPIKCSQLWSGTFGSSSVFFCCESAKSFVVELAQSEHEWVIRYESKSHKRERELRGTRRWLCFLPTWTRCDFIDVRINSPHMAVAHKERSAICQLSGVRGKWKRRERKRERQNKRGIKVWGRKKDDWITYCADWIMKAVLSGKKTTHRNNIWKVITASRYVVDRGVRTRVWII